MKKQAMSVIGSIRQGVFILTFVSILHPSVYHITAKPLDNSDISPGSIPSASQSLVAEDNTESSRDQGQAGESTVSEYEAEGPTLRPGSTQPPTTQDTDTDLAHPSTGLLTSVHKTASTPADEDEQTGYQVDTGDQEQPRNGGLTIVQSGAGNGSGRSIDVADTLGQEQPSSGHLTNVLITDLEPRTTYRLAEDGVDIPDLGQPSRGHVTNVRIENPKPELKDRQTSDVEAKLAGHSEPKDGQLYKSSVELVPLAQRLDQRYQQGTGYRVDSPWAGMLPGGFFWPENGQSGETAQASEADTARDVMGTFEEKLFTDVVQALITDSPGQTVETTDPLRQTVETTDPLRQTVETTDPLRQTVETTDPDTGRMVLGPARGRGEKAWAMTTGGPAAKISKGTMKTPEADPLGEMNGADGEPSTRTALDAPDQNPARVTMAAPVEGSSRASGDGGRKVRAEGGRAHHQAANGDAPGRVDTDLERSTSRTEGLEAAGYLIPGTLAGEKGGEISVSALTSVVKAGPGSKVRGRRDSDMEDKEELGDDLSNTMADPGVKGGVKDDQGEEDEQLSGGDDQFMSGSGDGRAREPGPKADTASKDMEKMLIKTGMDMNALGDLLVDSLPDTMSSGQPSYGFRSQYSGPEPLDFADHLPATDDDNAVVGKKKEDVSDDVEDSYGGGGDAQDYGLDKLSVMNNKLNELIREGELDQRMVANQQSYRRKREADEGTLEEGEDLDVAGYNAQQFEEEDLFEDRPDDRGDNEQGNDDSEEEVDGRARHRTKRSDDVSRGDETHAGSPHRFHHPHRQTHGKTDDSQSEDKSGDDKEEKTAKSANHETGEHAGEEENHTKKKTKKKRVKVTGVGYILFNTDGTVQAEQHSGSDTLDPQDLAQKKLENLGQGHSDNHSDNHHRRQHHNRQHHGHQGRRCNGSRSQHQGVHHHIGPQNCSGQDGSAHTQPPHGQHHRSNNHPDGALNEGPVHQGHHLPGPVVAEERRQSPPSRLVVQVLVVLSVCLFAFTILTYTIIKARGADEQLIKVNSRTALYQPYATY